MAELSPFVEATYGWPYSFDGWNGDMDQNLVKFSYLHDRNIDAIVSSLPPVVNGKAYFNTSDNRLYFDANGQRYSSVVPKWFEITLRTTGEIYQFNGSTINLGSVITDTVKADLASTNPLKGAALVGRASRQINSVAELRTVSGRYDGDQINLLGYFTTSKGLGAGALYWDASSTATDDGGLIFAVTGVTTGRWKRLFSGNWVNVAWFGAVASGDEYTKLQAAHNTLYNVEYNNGIYTVSQPIIVRDGQKARGRKGTPFSDTDMRTIGTTSVGGIPFFWQLGLATYTQIDGFCAEDMFLLSDIGVQIGTYRPLVEMATTTSPIMRCEFRRMHFKPINEYAVGTRGISIFQGFDHNVELCSFDKAEINFFQFGCDIGRVSSNRFTNAGLYHILDFSSVTLGSQTEIENNDMVTVNNTSGVFIKTCSNHVRIRNNYMEQGTVAGTLLGFIDMSATGMPSFGAPNPPSTLRLSSINVDANRIDGQSKATGFIHRIEAGRVFSATIHDVGTVGTVLAAPWLLLEGEVGLLVRHNASNYSQYDIGGGQSRLFQDMGRFKTKDFEVKNGAITIDAESLTSLDHTELGRNNAPDFIRLSDKGIIVLGTMLNTFTSLKLPPAEIVNPYLLASITYRVAITARAQTSGEVLFISRMVNGGVTNLSGANTLTTQFQTFTYDILGDTPATAVGTGFRRNSVNADPVYIKSITITPL